MLASASVYVALDAVELLKMDRVTQKLRTPAAARHVGLRPSTMAKMRVRGDGPAFSKAGPRVVVYDLHDLEDWLRTTRRTSTRTVS